MCALNVTENSNVPNALMVIIWPLTTLEKPLIKISPDILLSVNLVTTVVTVMMLTTNVLLVKKVTMNTETPSL